MTEVLIGPFYTACLLLGAAGGMKAMRPQGTARALRLAGVAAPTVLVRVLGSIEVLVAGAALLTGDRLLSATVATSYLAFALFVAWARHSGAPIDSCGCFGRVDTPPTAAHVVVNLALGGVCGAASLRPPAALPTVLVAQPLAGLPLAALTGVTAVALFLILGPAAQLLAVRRTRIGGGP